MAIEIPAVCVEAVCPGSLSPVKSDGDPSLPGQDSPHRPNYWPLGLAHAGRLSVPGAKVGCFSVYRTSETGLGIRMPGLCLTTTRKSRTGSCRSTGVLFLTV